METRHKAIIALTIVALTVYLAGLLVAASVWRADESASAPEKKSGSIEVGGRTRNFYVHTPPAYDGKKSLPIVLVLHAGGQSAESAEWMSGMSAKADTENFLVAYPSGTGRLSRMPTWNSGNCCGYAFENKVDDVAFLSALIDKLERDYSVDTKRVYVTGISNGGMMSYRLACAAAGKIAAIAPVEGAQNVECRPAAPVSVVVFHGTDDHLVAFDGGTTRFQVWPGRTDNSVASAVSFWAHEDACADSPQIEKASAVHTERYAGCKDGTAVALYAIQGGHHNWPGSRMSGNHVPATDIMWAFFAEHPKQWRPRRYRISAPPSQLAFRHPKSASRTLPRRAIIPSSACAISNSPSPTTAPISMAGSFSPACPRFRARCMRLSARSRRKK